MIVVVKLPALVLLIALQFGCTTLENRRDLYSPEPAPDSPEAKRQMITKPVATPEPKPQFR